MEAFFYKVLKLVSLIVTLTFALSFVLLCFEALLWFTAVLMPAKHAIIGEYTAMQWLTSVFNPTWITCIASAILLIVLEFFLPRTKLAGQS